MATEVLIINPSYLKENTVIDPNIDEKYLVISIREAQSIYIRKALGTALYNDILNNISAGTVSSDYTTLLDTYIVEALKYWAVYEAIPYLAVKLTNKAVVSKTSDNSQGVSGIDLEKMQEVIKNKAEYYTERLILFVRQNQLLYPLINQPGTGYDTIFPEIDAFECSIFFNPTVKLPAGIEINKDRSILYYGL